MPVDIYLWLVSRSLVEGRSAQSADAPPRSTGITATSPCPPVLRRARFEERAPANSQMSCGSLLSADTVSAALPRRPSPSDNPPDAAPREHELFTLALILLGPRHRLERRLPMRNVSNCLKSAASRWPGPHNPSASPFVPRCILRLTALSSALTHEGLPTLGRFLVRPITFRRGL